MKKTIYLFPTILALASCGTVNKYNECKPENNYVLTNPVAIAKYNEKLLNKQIESIYYDNQENQNSKIIIGLSKYKKVEVKLAKDNNQVYTFYIDKYVSFDKECEINITQNDKSFDKNIFCYKSFKNENNVIKSEYGFFKNNNQYQLKELKNNITLFNVNHQSYSNGRWSYWNKYMQCPALYSNHPEYKLELGKEY